METDMDIETFSEGSKRESFGGVAYDITLKPAGIRSPFVEKKSNRVLTPTTLDDLDKKLTSAEERRKRAEQKKQEQAARELAKVQETLAKVAEEKASMRTRTLGDLEEKEEKRLALQEARRERLRRHTNHVETVRGVLSQAQAQVREKLVALQERKEQEKERKRSEQMNVLLEKLKEHEQHVKEVRLAGQVKGCELADKHMERMENTLRNKEKHIQRTLERLREHNIRIDLVRQKRLERQESDDKDSQ